MMRRNEAGNDHEVLIALIHVLDHARMNLRQEVEVDLLRSRKQTDLNAHCPLLNLLLQNQDIDRVLLSELPHLNVLVPALQDPRNRENLGPLATDATPIPLIQVTPILTPNDSLVIQVMVKNLDTENDVMAAILKIVIAIIAIPPVVKPVIANKLPQNKVSLQSKNDTNPRLHQNYLPSANTRAHDRLNYRPNVVRQVINTIEVAAKIDITDLVTGTSRRRNGTRMGRRRGRKEILVDGVFGTKMI